MKTKLCRKAIEKFLSTEILSISVAKSTLRQIPAISVAKSIPVTETRDMLNKFQRYRIDAHKVLFRINIH